MGFGRESPGVSVGRLFAKMGPGKHSEIQWLIPVPFFMIPASPGDVKQ